MGWFGLGLVLLQGEGRFPGEEGNRSLKGGQNSSLFAASFRNPNSANSLRKRLLRDGNWALLGSFLSLLLGIHHGNLILGGCEAANSGALASLGNSELCLALNLGREPSSDLAPFKPCHYAPSSACLAGPCPGISSPARPPQSHRREPDRLNCSNWPEEATFCPKATSSAPRFFTALLHPSQRAIGSHQRFSQCPFLAPLASSCLFWMSLLLGTSCTHQRSPSPPACCTTWVKHRDLGTGRRFPLVCSE